MAGSFVKTKSIQSLPYSTGEEQGNNESATAVRLFRQALLVAELETVGDVSHMSLLVQPLVPASQQQV